MEAELVGRDAELEALERLPDVLQDGAPGVALLSGEPGVGKSRLLSTAVDRWRQAGSTVLVGRCVDLGVDAPPYTPLAAALRQLDPRMAADVLDAVTGAVETPRARLYDLVRGLVERLARRRPTVVVVEDLHWVDPATRDVLRFLLSVVRVGRWGLVATYRPEATLDRPDLAGLLDDLGRAGTVQRLHLGRLSRTEVDALAAGLADEALTPRDLEDLHRRSGGIPLLVEELVAARRWGEPSGIPEQLRDLFLARVDHLDEPVREVVRFAAVHGAPMPDDVLVDAFEGDEEVVAHAVAEGVKGGVLHVAEGEVDVRHELLREVVRDALVPVRRAALHRRLATVLAARTPVDAAAVAHHREEAGQPRMAAEAALQAAADASRVHAWASAHAQLERVLAHWGDLDPTVRHQAGGHVTVLARAAEAAHLAGALDRATSLAEQVVAEALGPRERAGALERLARYAWVGGQGDRAVRTSRRALSALDDDVPDDLQAQVLSGHAWMLCASGDAESAGPWAERARACAERAGDPLQQCRALLAWAWAHMESEAGRAALDDATALAERLDADDELARAAVVRVGVATATGSMAATAAAAHQGWRLGRDRGMRGSYQVAFAAWEAEAQLALGAWDVAAERLEETTRWAPRGMGTQFLGAACARLAAVRGDVEEVERWRRRLEAGRTTAQPWPWTQATVAAAESAAWRGDLPTAWRLLGQVRDAAVTAADGFAWQWTAMAGRVVADAARAARPVLPPEDAAWSPPDLPDPSDGHGRAWQLTALAELARRDAPGDATPWRQAVTAWETVGDPYGTAHARWRLAETLLGRRTGRSEARTLLAEAHETARDLGAAPLADAVARTAAGARIDLADQAALPDDEVAAREVGLTPREMEVLHLVAAGRTNRDIGDHLGISPRTVGVHVSRLLRKLGAARRTEAVDVARRHGVLRS